MASTISREAERSAGALNRSAPSPPSPTAASPRPRIAHVVTRYLRGGSEKRVRDMVAAYPEADHHLILGAESDVPLARREGGRAGFSRTMGPRPAANTLGLGGGGSPPPRRYAALGVPEDRLHVVRSGV